MPFQKGHKKLGGRKRGTKNLLSREVAARLEELNFDPIATMVAIAQTPGTAPELIFRISAEVANYVWPKRKSIEHSGIAGDPIELNVSGTELLSSRIDSLARRFREGGLARGPE